MDIPALNPAVLAELHAIDPTLLSEFADLFLDDTPTLLAELREAAANGDEDSIRRLKRDLRATSAAFGATTLSALCATFVPAAYWSIWLLHLETEYAQVASALKTLA